MPSMVSETEYLFLIAGGIGCVIYGLVAWFLKR